MTTHVFIVDSTTFKIHLEYLFAGTGSKKKNGLPHEGVFIDFNNNTTTSLHFKTEDNLVGMIADTNRVRRGDQIIFYLQQDFPNNIFDGKFFGIFKVKQDWAFLDNYTDDQYLNSELNKSLTFRVSIDPYKVYSEGVTEWEALDEIKNIQAPNQMLWSLIYRKLKGNRGNTMITIYESERLCQLIRNKNDREELNCNDKLLSFDLDSQKIVRIDQGLNIYEGRKEDVNILPRLIAKSESGRSFESHLQSYIVKNIGIGINEKLDEVILEGSDIEWLGNEVRCGVGMQSIDIMLSLVKNEQKVIVPVELKAVEAGERNIIQIQRYIDWIEQYYIPNRHSDIQPVLISKTINNKVTDRYQKIIQSFEKFNSSNSSKCKKLKYVEFDIENNDLIFNDVDY